MTSGGGQRETELARFMTRFERGVAWRRRKELVSRDGVTPRFTGVHRVFAFTFTNNKIRGGGREQEDAKDRERRASMGRILRRINYNKTGEIAR